VAIALVVGAVVFLNRRHHYKLEAVAAKAEEDRRLKAEDAKKATEERAALEKKQSEERQEQQKIQDKEKREAELKAYKIRYLGNEPVRREIAVLIVTEDGKPNKLLSNAFVTMLNSNGFNSTASLFTSDFVSDGLFSSVYGGSKAPIDKLELPALVDTLLLGQQTVNYSANPGLENLITAEMILHFSTLPLNNRAKEYTHKLKVLGAELEKRERARAVAEERIIEQLQSISAPLSSSLKPASKQP
jgi:hypothetical protein